MLSVNWEGFFPLLEKSTALREFPDTAKQPQVHKTFFPLFAGHGIASPLML